MIELIDAEHLEELACVLRGTDLRLAEALSQLDLHIRAKQYEQLEDRLLADECLERCPGCSQWVDADTIVALDDGSMGCTLCEATEQFDKRSFEYPCEDDADDADDDDYYR
jgi:hypothetical protein